MNDHEPGRPASSPARGAPAPRAGRDEIMTEISTRAGLVTVVFTGQETARACPAAGAFTYRSRQYAGSVLLAGPSWRGTATLGLSLYPAGGPAGRSTRRQRSPGIIAADVAAYLRDHSEILDLAAQARARAAQARAQRDLAFLAAEIVAAEHHLGELRRKQELRAIAGGLPEDTGQEQPPGPAQAAGQGRVTPTTTWSPGGEDGCP